MEISVPAARALKFGDGRAVRGPVLDGAVLDGAVLDGAVLDGPVLDGPVLNARVKAWLRQGRIRAYAKR